MTETNALTKMTDKEVAELAEETTIDGPDGEESLDMIMTDIAAGHNEIEQYKLGALSLAQRIKERLQEEKQARADCCGAGCPRCDLLEDVQESAMALYLRIEHGDAELTGRKEGEHSGRLSTDK